MPRRHKISTTAILVATFLISGQAMAQAEPEIQESLTPSAVAGDDLATVTSTPLVTGEDFREVLADLEGQHVLVNLWATWCIPCVEELPDLEEFQKTHDPGDLRVITVAMDRPSERQAANEIVTRLAPSLKRYSNDDGFTAFPLKAFSWHWDGALPTTFLIDEGGSVERVFAGMMDEARLEFIDKLVGLSAMTAESP